MMYEVKIGFDYKAKRYEIGDLIKKEDVPNKTFKELAKMGVIDKVDDLNKTLNKTEQEEE